MSLLVFYASLGKKLKGAWSLPTNGLVDVSHLKRGLELEGHVSAQGYKNFYQAYSSHLPINQMKACAGNNERKKLIVMVVKTFDIGMIEATGLLNRTICDTASDINEKKLNCAKVPRIAASAGRPTKICHFGSTPGRYS